MDQRTKLLCENVFELSAMAEEFEKQFDPATQDYLTKIESFGRRKLLGTFQTEPEPGISM